MGFFDLVYLVICEGGRFEGIIFLLTKEMFAYYIGFLSCSAYN